MLKNRWIEIDGKRNEKKNLIKKLLKKGFYPFFVESAKESVIQLLKCSHTVFVLNRRV